MQPRRFFVRVTAKTRSNAIDDHLGFCPVTTAPLHGELHEFLAE